MVNVRLSFQYKAGDIVFVDATSGLDRSDVKLVHLVCPSPLGGLPLADMILTREDEKTFTFGLKLLKSILPANAFYGGGADAGLRIFMTDDCDGERKSLASVWAASILLLCVFHILQAMWSWLWEEIIKLSIYIDTNY